MNVRFSMIEHTAQRNGRIRPAWLVLLAALATGGPAQAQAVQTRSGADAPIATELAVATFDSAWSRIRNAHYDESFNGLDWDAVRGELLPRARASATVGDLRAVLVDMLSRLGESHYTLIPQEAADAVDPARVREPGAANLPGDLGLSLRLAGGRLVVWTVDPDGPAARAGVRPGWIVDAVDARRPEAALARIDGLEPGTPRRNALTQFLWGANAQMEGPAGTRVNIRFLDADDRTIVLELERRRRPGEPVRFGNLPAFFAELSQRTVPLDGGGCLGVIRFNIWMVPLAAQIDRAVDAVRDCAGIVIDLRGNPGGIAGMVMGVAGHFLDDRVTLGTMRSRGSQLNFRSNPRRVDAAGRPVEPFAGPVAVLVDGLSVSTSEFFAGGMQAVGRVRVFGDTTAGQALPATLMRLPNDDVLMYVVADFTSADGARLEGRGVVPDRVVPLLREDLLAGRDAAFEEALAWIRSGGAREEDDPHVRTRTEIQPIRDTGRDGARRTPL